MLHIVRHGQPTALPPLLVAHGLFGAARNWGVLARRLSDLREVVVVDMRNHGNSFRSDVHDYPAMAGDLAEVIEALGGSADVMGHSMGGKASMVLALSRPESVRKLVVLDIAPVAYEHSQQAQIDAMRRVDLATVTSRREAAAMLEAESPAIAAFLLQSLDLEHRRWDVNIDVLEAMMPTIVGFPEVTGRYDGPALFLSGADSSYVLPEHQARIKTLFPAAHFSRIKGAGHWVQADRPREVEGAVRVFLGS